MNRILFEPAEIVAGTVTVADARAAHILGVLHGEVGDVLKTGEIDGKTGCSEIIAVDVSRPSVTLRTVHDREAAAPWADLILAPPRPRVLKRLLPQLAARGVGKIFLVGAAKVERDFWGATLLKTENYRPLLVEGLMQCGMTALPTVETRRNFRRFVQDELSAALPSPRRLVAHPYAAGAKAAAPAAVGGERLTLAIGPEGGWTDAEVELLEAHGFTRYVLGERILKTETAAVALLGRLMG